MRVLYGVQATGNGHITRARVMAPALVTAGVEVDYLFSGRPADQFFDMECFGHFETRKGLTFKLADGGRVNLLDTLVSNDIWQFWRDTRALDLTDYDLVITDFEPISAWAAKQQGVRSIGLAHQYAFLNPLPDGGYSKLLKPGIKLFAPVDLAVGVHWDAFGGTNIPPLIAEPSFEPSDNERDILVYLPFEQKATLERLFAFFPTHRFHVFCRCYAVQSCANVIYHPLSRQSFEQHMAYSGGVISNCGFGLASEALQYGKKLLSLPMPGQWEQQSNAKILSELGLATVVSSWDIDTLGVWLAQPSSAPMAFNHSAGVVAQWIANGAKEPVVDMVDRIWPGDALKVSGLQ